MTNEQRTEIYLNGAYTEPKDGDLWDFEDGTFMYENGIWKPYAN